MSKLRLTGSTSGFTELTAPAVAGSNTLTLPTGNGSNGQVLSTNGSGALSWIGAGKILQVVSTTKTDTFSSSVTAGNYVDVTGLSVSITPSSSSNKVLVFFSIGACGTSATSDILIRLVRGSTAIAVGNSATYTSTVAIRTLNTEISSTPAMLFLDSPATTSSTTYKITASATGSTTLVVNRRQSDTTFNGVSTITVMEVAA